MAEIESYLDFSVRVMNELSETPHKTVLKIGKATIDLKPGSEVTFENSWGKETVRAEEDGSFAVTKDHDSGWWDFRRYHKNQISTLLLSSGALVSIKQSK